MPSHTIEDTSLCRIQPTRCHIRTRQRLTLREGERRDGGGGGAGGGSYCCNRRQTRAAHTLRHSRGLGRGSLHRIVWWCFSACHSASSSASTAGKRVAKLFSTPSWLPSNLVSDTLEVAGSSASAAWSIADSSPAGDQHAAAYGVQWVVVLRAKAAASRATGAYLHEHGACFALGDHQLPQWQPVSGDESHTIEQRFGGREVGSGLAGHAHRIQDTHAHTRGTHQGSVHYESR